MPRLSIVIPAVDSIASLESTLVSVLENRPEDCEILVVLNQEYRDPYSLAGEIQFVEAPRGASYIACAIAGIQYSTAPVIHLLASGCEVAEGWADAALVPFANRLVGSVTPILYDRLHRDRVVAAGIGYSAGGRRRMIGRGLVQAADVAGAAALGPTSCAGFFRRSALEAAEGFCESLGLAADVDLALALQRAGWQTAVQRHSHVFTCTEVVLEEPGYRGALHAERLFWRNVGLAGRGRSLAMHPLSVFAGWVRALPQWGGLPHLAGRLVGLATARRYFREQPVTALPAEPDRPVSMPYPVSHPHRRVDGPHTPPRQDPVHRGARARAG